MARARVCVCVYACVNMRISVLVCMCVRASACKGQMHAYTVCHIPLPSRKRPPPPALDPSRRRPSLRSSRPFSCSGLRRRREREPPRGRPLLEAALTGAIMSLSADAKNGTINTKSMPRSKHERKKSSRESPPFISDFLIGTPTGTFSCRPS